MALAGEQVTQLNKFELLLKILFSLECNATKFELSKVLGHLFDKDGPEKFRQVYFS